MKVYKITDSGGGVKSEHSHREAAEAQLKIFIADGQGDDVSLKIEEVDG